MVQVHVYMLHIYTVCPPFHFTLLLSQKKTQGISLQHALVLGLYKESANVVSHLFVIVFVQEIFFLQTCCRNP